MALIDRRNQGLAYQLPRTSSMPVPSQRPAPTPIAPRPGSSPYAQMAANMANAKAATEQQEEGGGGGIGRALGYVLKPLEVLDYPRRAAILGVEQAALALPDWAEAFMAVPTLGIGGLTMAVDEDKVREDERSNWEKFRDPTYGFGQITGDTGNKWLDRTVGLVGDVALDPLTYATFGAGSLAKKGLATTGRAARLQRVADAAQELNRTGLLDDDAVRMLRRVAEEGYSPAKGAVRQALDLDKSGVRFQLPFTSKVTPALPGTQTLAKAVNKPIEAVRGATNRSNVGQRIAGLRTPKELEKAYPILTGGRGTDTDFLRAIDVFAHDQARRRGAGRFKGLAAQELRQRSEAIRGEIDNQYGGNLNEYLRATEVGDVETELNRLSKRMVEIAGSLGVDLPEIEGIGYIPHLLSPEFKRILDSGDPFAEEFKRAVGVHTNDTLRDSGFLSPRAFRPDPTGRKAPLKIGDRELKITEGSIAEINDKVAELFPGLKTTALETDPMTLFEKYIEGVAGDVGKRYANRQVAEAGLGGVRQFDNVSGQETLVQRGAADPMADNEFFRSVKDDEASAAMNERIAEQAQETIDRQLGSTAYPEYGGSDVLRRQVADEASDYRREVVGTLREQRNELSSELRRTADRMAAISQEVKAARPRQAAILAEADTQVRRLRAEAGAITRRLKTIPGNVREAATESQREVVRKLNARLNELRDQAEQLNLLIADYVRPEAVGELQRIRSELTAPLRAAQKAYDDAVAALTPSLPAVRTADEAAARAGLAETQRAEQAAAGIDAPYGPLAPESQQARITTQAADETAAVAPEAAAVRKAEQELQDLVAARSQVSTLERRISLTADEIAQRKQAIATYDERRAALLKTELRGKAYQERLGPAPADLRAANVRAQKNLTAMRKEHRKLSRRSVQRDIDAKIAAKQAEVDQLRSQLTVRTPDISRDAVEEARRRLLMEDMRVQRGPMTRDEIAYVESNLKPTGAWDRMFPTRRVNEAGERMSINPREVSRLDYLNKLIAELDRGLPAGTARRVEGLRRGIPRTETRLMENVAQVPGSATRAIEDSVDPEIAYRSALPKLKRSQKLRQADEAKAEAARQVRQIDEEIGGSYDEYRQLMTDDQALRQRRYEVQKAIDAAPPSRDASNRLNRSAKVVDEGDNFPSETFGLRPDRGEPARALRSAKPTDPGLHRVQPLASSLDDIEQLVKLNPSMSDEDLRRAEVLLHRWRTMLDNASTMDMKANQAQEVLNSARKGEMVDVVTAVLDQNKWKLMEEGDIVMAQEMARLMQNVAAVRNEPRLFGQTLTAFTNFFKTYATLSPGFHVRNAISATFMNSADGVPMRATLAGTKKWQQFLSAPDPLKFFDDLDPEWKQAFDAVFGSGTGGRFLEEGVAQATVIGRTRLKEGIYRNRATVWSQGLGERVEGAVRLGMALDTIQRGGSVNDALNRISRIHFDYSQVSQFDESAKRLIPFWTFMSRNLPMQITQMWMKPRRYNQFQSFVRNFSVEPDQFTPEYILTTGGFDTGETTPDLPGMAPGMPIFLQPDLAHTRVNEDIQRLLNVRENPGGVLSDFNPFFTAPIEYATGRDLFTGRVYQDDDYKPAEGAIDKALLPLLWALGQTKQGTDGNTYIQERGIDALRSLAPPLDRISRLAPGQSTGDNDRAMESYLRFFGVPVRTVSDEQRRNEQRSRYYDALDERDLQRVLAGG